jgi:hypothetical protein
MKGVCWLALLSIIVSTDTRDLARKNPVCRDSLDFDGAIATLIVLECKLVEELKDQDGQTRRTNDSNRKKKGYLCLRLRTDEQNIER